ncbi:MAG: SRPBCC domain-containing protein [Gaiellaceae bacterium]
MSTTTMTDAIRKTVLVDFTPEEAFDLFTARITSWWPVRSHSYGGDKVTNVVVEPRVGGRVYEVTPDGEQDWAKVLAWEPPSRLLLDWQIGKARGTEVEVTFSPEGPGSRVVLEHRGFGGDELRDRYAGGWDAVLAPFTETASKKA